MTSFPCVAVLSTQKQETKGPTTRNKSRLAAIFFLDIVWNPDSIVDERNELPDKTASKDPKTSSDDSELLYVPEIISPLPDTSRPKTRSQSRLDSLVYSEPTIDIPPHPSETEAMPETTQGRQ